MKPILHDLFHMPIPQAFWKASEPFANRISWPLQDPMVWRLGYSIFMYDSYEKVRFALTKLLIRP